MAQTLKILFIDNSFTALAMLAKSAEAIALRRRRVAAPLLLLDAFLVPFASRCGGDGQRIGCSDGCGS